MQGENINLLGGGGLFEQFVPILMTNVSNFFLFATHHVSLDLKKITHRLEKLPLTRQIQTNVPSPSK